MKYRSRTILAAAVFGFAVLMGAVNTRSADAFSSNDVVGGTQTIYNLDTNNVGHANPSTDTTNGIDNQGALSNGPSCRQEIYNAAGAAGMNPNTYTMNNGLSGNIQASSGGGVRSLWWLSQKNSPGKGNAISVSSGQQVTLQANYMLFFCAPSTGPTFGNVSAQYVFDHSPWSLQNQIVDGPPILSGQQGQGYTNVYWQIQSVTVSTDPAGNNPASNGRVNIVNRSSKVNKDTGSRFWVGSPSTQFTFTPNFTGTREIYVTATAKSIRHYSNGSYVCNKNVSNASAYPSGPSDWGRCYATPLSWKFTITVDDHKLTPAIQVAPSSVPLGGQISVNGSVAENQNVDIAANWNIARVIYQPGAGVVGGKGAATDAINPCSSSSYRGGASSCYYANYNTVKYNFSNSNGYAAANNSLDAVDWPVGTTICYVTSVNNYSTGKGDGGWGHSDMKCSVVSKTPKLSISGGDFRTLSDIDTSQNSVNGQFYGSWVEYGAFADGTNQHGYFGSGATLRPIAGQGVPSLSAAATNPLTFANATLSPRGSGPYGSFGGAGVQTTLADSLTTLLPKAGSVAGSRDLGSLASGRYDATSALTLHGTVGSGKSIVINAKGQTVAIDGNIAYSGTASAPNDIPQVVIIAKSIVIKDSVDTVSAWLLADTSSSAGVNFVTCDIGGAIAATTLKIGAACDKKRLTINGPATANKAHFYRTAGASDKDHQGETSESFNLPSNTYIWQYQQAAQSVAPTTVQVTQLPPRY